jgi:hypothetical protein
LSFPERSLLPLFRRISIIPIMEGATQEDNVTFAA